MSVTTQFPTANETGGAGSWTNPDNAHADDGVYAVASPPKNNSRIWHYLTFGFDSQIPAGSSIDAVKIIYEYNVSTAASIATMSTYARISDVDQTSHDDTSEPTSDSIITVDVTADRSWTRADLLDAAFKVVLSAQRGNSNTSVDFNTDYVKVEVTYTAPPAAVEVNSFSTSTVTEATPILLHLSNVSAASTVTLAEDVSVQLAPALLDVSDSLTVTDDSTVLSLEFIDDFDTITLTDAVTLLILENHNVNVADTISVTEAPSLSLSLLSTDLSDSITIAESVTTLLSITVDVVDTAVVTDSITVTATGDLSIDVNDTITLAETRTVSLQGLNVDLQPCRITIGLGMGW